MAEFVTNITVGKPVADSCGDSHVLCTLMAELVGALWMWPQLVPSLLCLTFAEDQCVK